MSRYNNILETIGNTPLVKLQKLAPPGVNLYVKIESFNPMGSVKDRMACAVIEQAERDGKLKPGQTVIEATSGNTGIGLAMVCAQKGYPLVVVMAENFSVERRKLLRFLGAKVVLTPASDKGTGMLAKAQELATAHGYFLCRQFDNAVNADVHYRTTAQEIIDEFGDEKLHYWVSGFGTGGTLQGVARALKSKKPETAIVAVEPDNSQILGSGITQPRNPDGTLAGSHPHFRPHLMQGWSPDFISRLTEEAVMDKLVDQIVPVAGERALQLARELARKEGIFVGISSGATLAGAIKIAEQSPLGTNIVCMLPDTGERYMSTPLFDDILAEMNEVEFAISRSTPSCQFAESAPSLQADPLTPELDEQAVRFVGEEVADQPVLMFALEWCEFCWSVRKLFKALQIPYKSIDLDAVEYQKNNWGGKIRQVLAEQLGEPTIPQIFIAGEHLGGSTELFDAYSSGYLQKRLREQGITFDEEIAIKPESMLPQWLHPRKSA